MPAMIYHAPYPIGTDSSAASAIRPRRMRQAFAEAGYRVFDVVGDAPQRRARMRALRRRIDAGERFEFLYGENATVPTTLTEKRHLPPHPLLDHLFFGYCRRHKIPTGMFYRDVYWRYGDYRASVGPLLTPPLRALYRWDLASYRRVLDVMFLPSRRMAAHVPIFPASRTCALPPGSPVVDTPEPPAGRLNLFYVGGLGGYYRLETMAGAAAAVAGVSLTICTRPAQWEAEKNRYAGCGDALTVVHASGAELEPHYAAAAVCVLFMEPNPYRDFAVPLKLYEYLGHGRPVIASRGTLVGDYVAEHGCGWAIPYERRAAVELLRRLRRNPDEVARAAAAARRVRAENTWVARARQAARTLGRVRRG